MKRTIVLKGEDYQYVLKISNRARALRLAIYHDGSFVVTMPNRANERIVEDFILKKSKWILDKVEYFKKNPRKEIIKHSEKEIREYKLKAKEYVLPRLQYWNGFYNFRYNKITIKNVKSRWGSCSRKGNLNFSYKIALLSQELADYIIVHELCHLGEMNHSSKFWKLVEKTFPNHKELRKQLKQQGV